MRGWVAISVAPVLLLAAGTGPAAPSTGCTGPATTALVHRFVASYAAGRVAAIDRMWAPEPRFQWYSTLDPGRRLGARAYDRSTLAAYFRSRVRAHERIRLLELGAGYDPDRKLVDFGGKLVRRADDMRRPR